MAERRDFEKTAAGLEGMSFTPEKKKRAKNYPLGVYLDDDTKAEIERIAKESDITRHALLQYAVYYFLNEYKKDPEILRFEEQITLKKPG
jgi:hypothetical protein